MIAEEEVDGADVDPNIDEFIMFAAASFRGCHEEQSPYRLARKKQVENLLLTM